MPKVTQQASLLRPGPPGFQEGKLVEAEVAGIRPRGLWSLKAATRGPFQLTKTMPNVDSKGSPIETPAERRQINKRKTVMSDSTKWLEFVAYLAC